MTTWGQLACLLCNVLTRTKDTKKLYCWLCSIIFIEVYRSEKLQGLLRNVKVTANFKTSEGYLDMLRHNLSTWFFENVFERLKNLLHCGEKLIFNLLLIDELNEKMKTSIC